ncbi:MAG: hypothetical protein UY04_C0011G0014 [Parcubacteria group bacterium GW2011_GWA2_47_7]|nr:MAG: hypothetical protein UY04_C0011G0014 [Parcubacteria group bacterium GW2011_GWA2_47_7]
MNNTDKKITVVTHSGTFHADEVLAVAVLEIFFDGKPYEVIRTRDQKIIDAADYVVDVGAIYDPETNRFDHHQHGGAGARPNGIPYSSFGLVWKHFGEAVCGSKSVVQAIDEQIGYPVDMGDNGIDYYGLVRIDTEPLILQFIVAMFRPTWKGDSSHDERFFELVVFMRRFIELAIQSERDKVDGAAYVHEAYRSAEDKRLIILDGAYPWQDVLAMHPEPLYVVKPKNQNTFWEVECVRDNPHGFASRKNLPMAWAGKFDGELVKATGVSDAVFCHNKQYIAVTKTKEGAIRLARMALSE